MKTVNLPDDIYYTLTTSLAEAVVKGWTGHGLSDHEARSIQNAAAFLEDNARDATTTEEVKPTDLPKWLGMDAKTALDTPPVNWGMLATTLAGEGLRKTAEQLIFLCVHISRAAGYFDSRDRGNDHAKAVQESNRAVAKVRKAFGFTRTKDDLSF